MKLIKTDAYRQKQFASHPSPEYHQKFAVSYDFPVLFTHDLFHPQNPVLMSALDRLSEPRCHKVKVFVDSGVVDAMPDLEERIQRYFEGFPQKATLSGKLDVLPGGETAKNGWDVARRAMGASARAMCPAPKR